MIAWALMCWLCSTTQANPELTIQINGGKSISSNSVEVTVDDTVVIRSSSSTHWVQFKPVLKEYDNLRNGPRFFESIEYVTIDQGALDILVLNQLKPGTYFFGIWSNDNVKIRTYEPVHLINTSVVQVVVRKNNTYLGFLTELLNVPFVIPPKTVPNFGHQTDLRVGTDCAELAIYGRRRNGYKVPYGGPRGIKEYLVKTNKVIPGVILHFGFQVSVLYEDRGQPGTIDSEDLLIHAYLDKVSIQRLGDIDLYNKAYELYTWKDHNTE